MIGLDDKICTQISLRRLALCALTALLLVACSSGGGSEPPSASPPASPPSSPPASPPSSPPASPPAPPPASPPASPPSSPSAAQVSIAAPLAVTIDATTGETVLRVAVRLHNPTDESVQLFAGTPCAVFRWTVTSADKIVQRKPNQLCAQVVAAAVLLPNESIEQEHKIVLDKARYSSGAEYLLRYQFWQHDGIHSFTLTD